MKPSPAAIGIDDHNGWAYLVVVAVLDGKFSVCENRRAALMDADLPNQPYHHETLSMNNEEADQLVAEVVNSALRHAREALQQILDDFENLEIESIAIRNPILPALPATVAEAHASYPVTCRADGMIYHHALCRSAEELGLSISHFDRKTVLNNATIAMGIAPEKMQEFLKSTRKAIGPPFTKQHQLAFAGAIVALTD